MTDELYYKIFDYWKQNIAKNIDLCQNANFGGGFGYTGFTNCLVDKDVHYGGKMCRENCKLFSEASKSSLMVKFNMTYAKDPELVKMLFDRIGITDYTEDDLTL